MKYIIYKVTNLINQKIYIGSTHNTIKHRFMKHVVESNNRCSTYFHKAIRKYGKENFKIEELFFVFNESDLNYFEDLFIDQYNSLNPNVGYNLVYSDRRDGANKYISECMKKDWQVNRESRLESARNMKNNAGWGSLVKYNKTDEARAAASVRSKARWDSGAMNHVSETMKDQWSDSEIRKQRIEAMKEGAKKKAVIAVSIYGDKWEKFNSVHDAIRAGFCVSSIYNSLNKKATHGQGFVWLYAEGLDNYEALFAEVESVLGGWHQKDDQPIQALDPKTGIKTVYPNLEAVRAAGFSIKSINRSISGKRKSAQGYIWSYL